MNFSLPTVVMFGIGAILVYSSVKNKDPRNVVREAMGQKPVPTTDKGFNAPPNSGGGGEFKGTSTTVAPGPVTSV